MSAKEYLPLNTIYELNSNTLKEIKFQQNEINRCQIFYNDIIVKECGDKKYIQSIINKAIIENDSEAQWDLAGKYSCGFYLQVDFQKSFLFYKMSSENEVPKIESMKKLSILYRIGLGTKKNIEESEKWLKKYNYFIENV